MNEPEIEPHKLPVCFNGGSMGVQRCNNSKCRLEKNCGFRNDHRIVGVR